MLIRTIDKTRITDIAHKVLKEPLELWAYGSRVTGQAHDCSDLDIVVRTQSKEPLPISQMTDFQEALEESNIPFIVQVFDWAKLPQTFHQNILQDYEVLFSNCRGFK